MKKLGFTLAEVLIALSIVGVISALTIPTLVSENQKKVQAATLAVAVSDFETAMHSMITAEDVQELFDTKAWEGLTTHDLTNSDADNAKNFMGNISDYLELSDYSGAMDDFYAGRLPLRGISGDNFDMENFDTDSYAGFKATNGVEYFIYIEDSTSGANGRISDSDTLENQVVLQEEAGRVIIDVNGAAQPNMVGRDLFFFILGSDGVLYPYGGRDFSYYKNGNVDDTWNNNGNYRCTDNSKTDYGIGCTARLIESGYKMDY